MFLNKAAPILERHDSEWLEIMQISSGTEESELAWRVRDEATKGRQRRREKTLTKVFGLHHLSVGSDWRDRCKGDYLGVGGTSAHEDQRILQLSGVHVVVGTPGRVFDMLRREYFYPDSIKMFVLDEADEIAFPRS
ncbi:hypothetical protein Dimus_035359 [Dionaea muscipula]